MDIAVVDALARLELAARRAGLRVVVADVSDDLRLLVRF